MIENLDQGSRDFRVVSLEAAAATQRVPVPRGKHRPPASRLGVIRDAPSRPPTGEIKKHPAMNRATQLSKLNQRVRP